MTKDIQLQRGSHKSTEVLKTNKTLEANKVTKRKMEEGKERRKLVFSDLLQTLIH